MYEPNPGDAKPPVFEPMEMSTAEALLKEAKEILDGLGIVFFFAAWHVPWRHPRPGFDRVG